MEIAFLISCIIGSGLIAAYYFADSKSFKKVIELQNETISVLRAELKDWQNKALVKNGLPLLGAETKKKEKDITRIPTQHGVTRAQMEAQHHEDLNIQQAQYPRVRPEFIEEARKIKTQQ